MKKSSIASTSASTLQNQRLPCYPTAAAAATAQSSVNVKGKEREIVRTLRRQRQTRHPNAESIAWVTSAMGLLQLLPLARGQEGKAYNNVMIQARGEMNNDKSTFRLSHNLPIQLVIVIASIVLFGMFITSIACLFRKSSRSIKSGGKATKKNTWSPGGFNSLYTFTNEIKDGSDSDHESSSNLSKEKSKKTNSALSPVSPMPALLMDGSKEIVAMPTPSHQNRSQGWQLFDYPVPLPQIDANDVESARRPSRRPSFIDRLLAHRADPNDARLPANRAVSLDGPRTPSGGRKLSGSAFLSKFGGPLNPLRSREPSQRLAVVDSDFEGTIGGKDGEIPMAKRIQANRGRFAVDDFTDVASPNVPNRALDKFSPLPNNNRFRRMSYGTPLSSGMAGLGSTAWATNNTPPTVKMDHGRVPTFAELQRHPISLEAANRWTFQSTIDQWVQGSVTAGAPPNSRRGSTNSFLTIGGASQFTMSQKDDTGLERIVSIRPHFAPTTTLASWLVEEGKEGLTEDEQENSIIEKYLACGSQVGSYSDTDFEPRRGSLWERHDQIDSNQSNGSHHRQSQFERGMHKENEEEPVEMLKDATATLPAWGNDQEVLEEEKRQIDRRQRYLLKEKKRAERRAMRQQREKAMYLAAEPISPKTTVEQQQKNHLILDMREKKNSNGVAHDYDQQRRAESYQQQLRLCPSINGFNAPVFSHQQKVQQQQAPSRPLLSKNDLIDRPSARAIVLSPPESPLTSASEGPPSSSYFVNRRSDNFLVPSSRSRSSASQRSSSHSQISQSHLQEVRKASSSKQYQPGSFHHHQHSHQYRTSKRSVSERHFVM